MTTSDNPEASRSAPTSPSARYAAVHTSGIAWRTGCLCAQVSLDIRIRVARMYEFVGRADLGTVLAPMTAPGSKPLPVSTGEWSISDQQVRTQNRNLSPR